MVNVILIAFEFPPLNRGGVHRPLAFLQFLPAFGINPIVITLDPSSYMDTFDTYSFDSSLGENIISSANVIRVKSSKAPPKTKFSKFTSIYFSIHGNEVKHWEDNFHRAILRVIEDFKPQAILATVPPFSVLPLSLKLAKRYQLPLIFDFRDAWSQWRTVPYGSIFHYWRTLFFERKYLLSADAIIATSEQTLADFYKLHPAIDLSKLHYLPNGYNGELEVWEEPASTLTKFTIGYVGSFYYTPSAREQMLKPWWKKKRHRIFQYTPNKQDWLFRSPYFFFQAIKRFNELYPSLKDKLQIKFVGKKPDWLIEMLREFGLESQVQLLGEVSHQDSLIFQRECDALLITSAKQFGRNDYSIAGKTFEYIQMQRPIVAFVCNGAQKDLLEQTGMALVCDPDQAEQSAHQIYSLMIGQAQLNPNQQYIQSLSRKALTGKLANLIKATIHRV